MIQQYTEIKTEAYYSNCNIQLSHNTDMIPITSLYMFSITTMGITRLWEAIHGLEPAQIIVPFKICSIGCLGFILYVGLSRTRTPCPMLDWLAEEITALCCLRESDGSLVWLSCLKLRLPSGLPSVEIRLAFFRIHYSPKSLLGLGMSNSVCFGVFSLHL